MEPLLSVIIPVYNVKDYIQECLDSILSQTYKNLDIILIDDGSSDGSGSICEEYAKNNECIRAIHKKNGGLSSSRNAGLEIVRGDYVTFVDSDDIIIGKDVFSSIMTVFREDEKLDVVQYDVIHKYTSPEEHTRVYPFKTYKNKVEILDGYLSQHIHVSCCDKVFKSSIFKDIRFPEKEISEDIAIIPQIIDKVNRLKTSNIGYYGYRYREGSITNSILPFNKICSILNSYSKYLKYSMLYSEVRQKAMMTYVRVFWSYLSEVRKNYPGELNEICSRSFFIRLKFKEWRKLIINLTFKEKLCSFILCCLGPDKTLMFQKFFTRQG